MEEKRNRINSGPRPSPHKIVPQVYIFEYKQPRSNSHNRKSVTPPKQNTAAPQPIASPSAHHLQPKSPRPVLPAVRPIAPNENYQIVPGEAISHRRNIDRLMEILKSKSKGKDRQQKSLHKIFKWVERAEKNSWQRKEQQFKGYALFQIKKAYTLSKKFHVEMTKQRTTPVTSMELLEKPEVEKTSANFQLDDSILNIVDAHEIGTRKTLNSQDFSNTLSRNLKNDYSPQSKQSTPKKLSKDLYILSKRSTALLTTKTNISSFKSDPKLPSSQEGPVTTPIKNIESKSPSKAVNTNAIQKEDPFTLRKRESVEASAHKVPELQAETPAFNKPEETDRTEPIEEQANQVSKFEQKQTKNDELRRSNRLMEASATRKRLISFNYNGKGEPITTAQTENYYILNKQTQKEPKEGKDVSHSRSTSKSKISFTYANKEKKDVQTTETKKESNELKPNSPNSPNTVAKGMMTSSETSRLIRVNSNKVLTASVFQPVIIQTSQQSGDQKAQVENHVITRKRCNSMPKITFTYKTKDEVFVSPQPANQMLHKNSPIFQLEQIHKEAKILPTRTPTPKKEEKDDPYLSKNIQVRNIAEPKAAPSPTPTPERPAIKQHILPENNYYIPVVSNLLPQKIISSPAASKPAERPRIISNYQTLPSTTLYSMQQSSNIALKAEEYYGTKQSALLSPTPADKSGRDRVRSIDAVLKREVAMTNSKSPQDMLTMQEYRERPRSLSSKMEVTIRKREMIAV